MSARRLFIMMPLAYSLFIVAQCPCGDLPSCHYTEFLVGIMATLLFLILENGL